MRDIIGWAVWALLSIPVTILVAVGISQGYQVGALVDTNSPGLPIIQPFGIKLALGSALAFGAMGALKAVLPVAWTLCQKRRYRAIAVVTFALLVAYSGLNQIGLATHSRADGAAFSAQMSERRADARAERDRLLSRVEKLEKSMASRIVRAVGAVEADLRAQQHSRSWTSSKGCTNATSADSRMFCTTYNRIEEELAAAREIAALRGTAEKLRTDTDIAGHAPIANADLATIQRRLNLDAGRAADLLVFFRVIVFELTEAFGVMLLAHLHDQLAGAHRAQAKRSSSAQPPRIAPKRRAGGPRPRRLVDVVGTGGKSKGVCPVAPGTRGANRCPRSQKQGTNVLPFPVHLPPPGGSTIDAAKVEASSQFHNDLSACQARAGWRHSCAGGATAAVATSPLPAPSTCCHFELYLNEGLVVARGAVLPIAAAYEHYLGWCQTRRLVPLSRSWFGRCLAATSLDSRRRRGRTVYLDVAVAG